MMYNVPEQYYFRIHQIRPRFKDDVENVLIYMASEISKLSTDQSKAFSERLDKAIKFYPGNSVKTDKTIANWRTEISSLFGFLEFDDDMVAPGRRAVELAQKQDLVEFFKCFLYTFQYPGAHLKVQSIHEQICAGVHFKPAQYILSLLSYAEKALDGKRQYITKAEACHCIFNDLRCTRDNESFDKVWNRIIDNRNNDVEYDESGDVIRYAGDILDYMENANLLVTHDSKNYYLNVLENAAILKFINSQEWFAGYDSVSSDSSNAYDEINSHYDEWFKYVNRNMSETDFTTDILAYISKDEEEYNALKDSTIYDAVLEKTDSLSTKEIGDIGEGLVHAHECQRLKINDCEELIHLVKKIPTQLAVGYDIQSVEFDAQKRYIEVKTTISSKPLQFVKFHMTTNEWCTAETMREKYYVYRLMISKSEKKLFILRNPVGLYKQDLIGMIPKDGADINFSTDNAAIGCFEELLTWES